MMDWTDRHCRFFHRQLSARALLYTEMVTAAAVIHGDREQLLGHDAAEHPVALQLGGSDPRELARAVALAAPWGYDEINLNCGCPSDRVQSGCFGAVLMKTPELVADCLAAMIGESSAEVTVKCRIGVDAQEPRDALPAFLAAVQGAGVRRVTIHARKAWLQGLSPKENRQIPPLDHDLVIAMKRQFPDLQIVLNGGIDDLDGARAALAAGLDGAMIGRAAYHHPAAVLLAGRCGDLRRARRWQRRGRGAGDAALYRSASGRWRPVAPGHPTHAGPVRRPARCAAVAAADVGTCRTRRRGSGPGRSGAFRGHPARGVIAWVAFGAAMPDAGGAATTAWPERGPASGVRQRRGSRTFPRPLNSPGRDGYARASRRSGRRHRA